MRAEDRARHKDALVAEHEAAKAVCCAACHAVSGAACTDGNGRERPPHKVRLKVSRYITKR